MAQHLSPREVFLALVNGCGAARRTSRSTRRPTPRYIVAEFEYQGTAEDTGKSFALPGIFVLRVRNGRIVSSRDDFDHVTGAKARGRSGAPVEAVRARGGRRPGVG
jgi:ketosteroid isomerase-like protein